MKYSINSTIIILFMICGSLLLCSCSTIPFKKPDLVPVNIKNHKKFLKNYNSKLPKKFVIVSSVVFYYHWRSFSSLGVCKVDIPQDKISLIGMNNMGMKLFEINSKKNKTVLNFAIDKFKKHQKFPNKIIKDVKRIYFNHVPNENYKINKKKKKLIFIQEINDNQSVKYEFGGAEGPFLLSKRFIKNGKVLWEVLYFEYKTSKNGKLFPHGIILNNYKYDYKLQVKLLEVRNESSI